MRHRFICSRKRSGAKLMRSCRIFSKEVIVSALVQVNYVTSEEALEEFGWEYTDYMVAYWEKYNDNTTKDPFGSEDTLIRIGLDPAQIQLTECSYGGQVFCCYDEEKDIFYTGRWGFGEFDVENMLYTIARMDDIIGE